MVYEVIRKEFNQKYEAIAMAKTLENFITSNNDIKIFNKEGLPFVFNQGYSTLEINPFNTNEKKFIISNLRLIQNNTISSFHIKETLNIENESLGDDNRYSKIPAFIYSQNAVDRLKSDTGLDAVTYISNNNAPLLDNDYVAFNLSFIKRTTVPPFFTSLKKEKLKEIKKVVIVGSENEDPIDSDLLSINENFLKTYEGIIRTDISEVSNTVLSSNKRYETPYFDFRLSSSFINGNTLYLPVSKISFRLLPYLIYEVGLLVKGINEFNIDVSHSWYFSNEGTMENLEVNKCNLYDLLEAKAILESRLSSLEIEIENRNKAILSLMDTTYIDSSVDNNRISLVFSPKKELLILRTKPLLVKDKDFGIEYTLGSIDIQMHQGDSSPIFFNNHLIVNGTPAPHANATYICLGNISTDVNKLMKQEKDINFLADYMVNLLLNPDVTDTWGSRIRAYPIQDSSSLSKEDWILLSMLRMTKVNLMFGVMPWVNHSLDMSHDKEKDEEKKKVIGDLIINLGRDVFRNSFLNYVLSNTYDPSKEEFNKIIWLLKEKALIHAFSYGVYLTPLQVMKALSIKENPRDLHTF